MTPLRAHTQKAGPAPRAQPWYGPGFVRVSGAGRRRSGSGQQGWTQPDDTACVRSDQLLAEPARCRRVGPRHPAPGTAALGVVDDLQAPSGPATVVDQVKGAQCSAHEIPLWWAGEIVRPFPDVRQSVLPAAGPIDGVFPSMRGAAPHSQVGISPPVNR